MTERNASPGKDPREIWEQRYLRARERGGSGLRFHPWLERWRRLLPAGSRVLDLGCGAGHDARWLSEAGCRVTAGDFSFSALYLARQALAAPVFLLLDLRQGIPVAPGTQDAVIANLCLHYFPWPQTVEILNQVRGCLKPEGALLARFNSTRDANFGAGSSAPVEPNAFLVDGMYKRYFDRESLEKLFAAGWRVLNLEEMTIDRYDAPKVLWEVVAIREES